MLREDLIYVFEDEYEEIRATYDGGWLLSMFLKRSDSSLHMYDFDEFPTVESVLTFMLNNYPSLPLVKIFEKGLDS